MVGLLLLLLVSGSTGSISKPSVVPLDLATLQQKASGVDLDLCPFCINFAEDFINDLLNIVLS